MGQKLDGMSDSGCKSVPAIRLGQVLFRASYLGKGPTLYARSASPGNDDKSAMLRLKPKL